MLSTLFSAEAFVYAALLFYVLGFLFRDELWLRGLILIGTGFYVIYYFYAADRPLWDAIVTSSILGIVNLWMICVVVMERTTFSMSPDQAQLYVHFQNLNPGQFRRLIKKGQILIAESEVTLSKENESLEEFFFIFDGNSKITKLGDTTEVSGARFIGEVAFLKGTSASATVTIDKGSRYVSWSHENLRKLMTKSPNLSNGLLALLNLDMAGKVASSQPVK